MDVGSIFPVMSALRITEPLTNQDTMDSSQESTRDSPPIATATTSKILVAVGTKQCGSLYVTVLPSWIGCHQPQGTESEAMETGPSQLQWQQIGGTGKGKLEW